MPSLPLRPHSLSHLFRFFLGSSYSTRAPFFFALKNVCVIFMVRFRSNISKCNSSILKYNLMKTHLFIQFSELLMCIMFSSAAFFFKFLYNQKNYLKNHKTMGEAIRWDCKQHITLHGSMHHLNIASFYVPSF